MIVVEFFGAPGSGKTFWSNQLISILNDNEIDCNASFIKNASKNQFLRIVIKIFFVFKFFLLKPSLALDIIKKLIKSSSSSFKRVFVIIFNFFYIQGLLYRGGDKNDVVLFDQGLVQLVYAGIQGEANLMILNNLLQKLKFSKMILFCLDVPKEVSKTQLQYRMKEVGSNNTNLLKLTQCWNESEEQEFKDSIRDQMIIDLVDLRPETAKVQLELFVKNLKKI